MRNDFDRRLSGLQKENIDLASNIQHLRQENDVLHSAIKSIIENNKKLHKDNETLRTMLDSIINIKNEND